MLNVISKISTIKVQLFRVFYLYSNEKPSMMPFESMERTVKGQRKLKILRKLVC